MRKGIERSFNTVGVSVMFESGCDPLKGEYCLLLTGIVGGLEIGENDPEIEQIQEAVGEWIHHGHEGFGLPEEGYAELQLREIGEREDMHWIRSYRVQFFTMADVEGKEEGHRWEGEAG